MFYEKRVRSLAGLKKEVRTLDADAGVRIVGSYLKSPCFAFVTRFAGRYTVMVYERRGGRYPAVGENLISREFESLGELYGFLSEITTTKVDAYVY